MSTTAGVLQLLQAKGIGERALSRILTALRQQGTSPADLGEIPSRELIERAGLRPDLEKAVEAVRASSLRLSEELEARGVQVLVRGFGQYPQRLVQALGESAPPVLFVKGDMSILQLPAVAFAGSRKSSEKGLAITASTARELAAQGVNVVSGYAGGVDRAAHRAALEARGATTFVLAEGIFQFRVRREIAEVLESGRSLIVSEFPPNLKWLARSAMQRNRTVCAFADAVLIVESGLSGGTFAAGEMALELRRPLFVVEYASPPASAEGNASFLARGATPLRRNGNGKASLSTLLSAVGVSRAGTDPGRVPVPETRNGPVEQSTGTADPENSVAAESDPAPRLSTPDTRPPGSYPKRLIEVDLPIKRISAHARREKSIRHGHISTLHIWWARRPLAACRAVICAALWPDPADPLCPQLFRDAASGLITAFARKVCGQGKIRTPNLAATCSAESRQRWEVLAGTREVSTPCALDPHDPDHLNVLRFALLDFIADFADWDNSTVPEYLETARALTQAAHEALGGEPGTRPLVVDPFAGGGSIPLEALRVGADAFASDLNPVAVLLNKVVLEYIPRYGQRLADEVRKWGKWVKEQAEKELAEFYPKDPDGATPIAYLWARTITCEGPGCGAEVPLIRSLWLAKKGNRSVALRLVPRPKAKRVDFEIVEGAKAKEVGEGPVKRGSATCPVCGFTTPVASVRRQLKERRGGAADARLFCVVTTRPGQQGRSYRLPSERDRSGVREAAAELARRAKICPGPISLVPDEKFTGLEPRRIPVPIYGMSSFGSLFTPRQLLALTTLVRIVSSLRDKLDADMDDGLAQALQLCLGLAIDKIADLANSLCAWEPVAECPRHLFARQAMPFTWDFAEGVVIGQSSGSWSVLIERFEHVMGEVGSDWRTTVPQAASATSSPLPDDVAQALITDPPYYYSVPYSDLSDFFYVWLRRTIGRSYPELFRTTHTSKDEECVQNLPHAEVAHRQKSRAFYEAKMEQALSEGRRVVRPDGVGTVVFAHSETDAWEALLAALIGAGWMVTGSWPIDTEDE
jgi:DNA protecting protein DprA